MNAIHVEDLRMIYRVPDRDEGLFAAIRSLGRRRYREVESLTGITFDVGPGEMIALIGPNGAGKTTTLKILSGLLHPTAGSVDVGGHVPWRRDHSYLRRIGMVMGNRQQLVWDVPVADSLRTIADIYGLPREEHRSRVDELSELLDLADVLGKPSRNLSLGERMKCELCASLLHSPDVVFLDEPTLGLDVTMQRRLRSFIRAYQARRKATIIITSHYMADVVELCRRVILINHGALLYDGDLTNLASRLQPFKIIQVATATPADVASALPPDAEVQSESATSLSVRVPVARASAVTAAILNAAEIEDLQVENPAIEDVIDQVYQEAKV